MTLRRFELYSFAGSPTAADAFAQAALDCARFIPEVLHSAIGRFQGPGGLNFAWEQAYASAESYRRYMEHPYHAARLDRYLMIDSPECIATDNGLGVGLIGYRCDARAYFLPAGARRVIGIKAAPGAVPRLERLAAEQRSKPGVLLSLFAENYFGPRWFDGETVITPEPTYSHIWEQGFESLAAGQADSDAWREELQALSETAIEVLYEIEPGYGYPDRSGAITVPKTSDRAGSATGATATGIAPIRGIPL